MLNGILLSFACMSKELKLPKHFSYHPHLFTEFQHLQGIWSLVMGIHKYSCINQQTKQLTQVIVFLHILAIQFYTCNHKLHIKGGDTCPWVLALVIYLACNRYYLEIIIEYLTLVLYLSARFMILVLREIYFL